MHQRILQTLLILMSYLGQKEERALGCVWIPKEDLIGVKGREAEVATTKRGTLQRVAMVFDPVGIIGPFTLRAKFFIQKLWATRTTNGMRNSDRKTYVSGIVDC